MNSRAKLVGMVCIALWSLFLQEGVRSQPLKPRSAPHLLGIEEHAMSLEESLARSQCRGGSGSLKCHHVHVCPRHHVDDSDNDEDCHKVKKCRAKCDNGDSGDNEFYMDTGTSTKVKSMEEMGSDMTNPLPWGSKQQFIASNGHMEGGAQLDSQAKSSSGIMGSKEGIVTNKVSSTVPSHGPGNSQAYAQSLNNGIKPEIPLGQDGASRNMGLVSGSSSSQRGNGTMSGFTDESTRSGDQSMLTHCPNDCSQHGYCRRGACVCNYKWSGPDCGTRAQLSDCPNDCSGHGACIDGKCFCHVWYQGDDCGQVREITACPNDCSNQGLCVDGKCLCHPSFYGRDCTRHATIHPSPDDCNGKGVLIAQVLSARPNWKKPPPKGSDAPPGPNAWIDRQLYEYTTRPGAWNHCVCPEGRYKGAACDILIEQTSCPKDCSTHGACMEGRCVCAPGYQGYDCSSLVQPDGEDCPNNCLERGACENHECVCHRYYEGEYCESRRKAPCTEDCLSRGVCERGSCFCFAGFAGSYCQQVVEEVGHVLPSLSCPGDCTGNGICNNGTCICDPGYSGHNCSSKVPCPNDCSEHGVCNEMKDCECHHRYTGHDCSIYKNTTTCPNDCSQHGICTDDLCQCHPMYQGEDCSIRKTVTDCPNDCNYRGSCKEGVCTCHPLFEGVDCGRKKCGRSSTCANDCSFHGVCSDNGHVAGRLAQTQDAETQTTVDCISSCKLKAIADKSVNATKCIAHCIATFSPDEKFASASSAGLITMNESRKKISKMRGAIDMEESGVGFKPLKCATQCASSNYDNAGIASCASKCMKASSVVTGHKKRALAKKHKKHRAQIMAKLVKPEHIASGASWPGHSSGDSSNATSTHDTKNKRPPPTGHCTCAAGWKGFDCSEPSPCSPCTSLRAKSAERCPEKCNGRGVCLEGKCICNAAYMGPACSIPVNGTTCEADCNYRGVCTSGSCTCRLDYTGPACATPNPLTKCPNDCSGHGVCDPSFQDSCLCAVGWMGPDCSMLEQTTQCQGDCAFHGVCGMPGTMSNMCTCHRLWNQQDCSQRKDIEHIGDSFPLYPGETSTRMDPKVFASISAKQAQPDKEELSHA